MDKYSRNDSTSYALGSSLVIEALLNIPEEIEIIYLSDKYELNDNYKYLDELCLKNNVKKEFNQRVIDKLSLKENCYAIGVFKKYQKDISTTKHILLYNFDNYGDLGTIMRSAVSFDFKDIILIGNNIDYFEPLCIRSSMGSIFHLNIKYYDNLEEYQKDYPNQIIYPFISNGKNLEELKLINNYSLLIPQHYHDLDKLFNDGYKVSDKEIALSSLSAIVFNYFYNK